MGCCTSRDKPVDERTPLLNESIESIIDDDSKKYIITKKKEEQVWKDIIDRTTKSMINISELQPLDSKDIEDRSKRYKKIVNNINTNYTCIDINQQDISNVIHLLTEAKPFNTMEISNELSQIDYAKNQINKSLIGHGHVIVHMKKISRRL